MPRIPHREEGKVEGVPRFRRNEGRALELLLPLRHRIGPNDPILRRAKGIESLHPLLPVHVHEPRESSSHPFVRDGEEGVDDFVRESKDGGVGDAEGVLVRREAAEEGETEAPDVDFGALFVRPLATTPPH